MLKGIGNIFLQCIGIYECKLYTTIVPFIHIFKLYFMYTKKSILGIICIYICININ